MKIRANEVMPHDLIRIGFHYERVLAMSQVGNTVRISTTHSELSINAIATVTVK